MKKVNDRAVYKDNGQLEKRKSGLIIKGQNKPIVGGNKKFGQ